MIASTLPPSCPQTPHPTQSLCPPGPTCNTSLSPAHTVHGCAGPASVSKHHLSTRAWRAEGPPPPRNVHMAESTWRPCNPACMASLPARAPPPSHARRERCSSGHTPTNTPTPGRRATGAQPRAYTAPSTNTYVCTHTAAPLYPAPAGVAWGVRGAGACGCRPGHRPDSGVARAWPRQPPSRGPVPLPLPPVTSPPSHQSS